MNQRFADIAGWLNIDIELAKQVEAEMSASGVHWGNSTLEHLKVEASIALDVVNITGGA
jgi:hypothetical protein